MPSVSANKEISPRKVKVLRDFKGMNTQATRYAIGDDEFSWLEGAFPIGSGNLRTVPGPSAILATLTGETINYMAGHNINNTDYLFCFCVSGAAYQIRLTDYTVTKFANAGTFTSIGPAIDQWKNERIVIIDPNNGYFDWNGTTLTTIAAGTKGTTISTFAGRVWIGQGRTITFTDAASYTSFAGAGGAITFSDSSLHSGITATYSANGFLYVFGVSSVNVVGDVRVSGGITLLSNVNLTASIGTGFFNTVTPLGRNIEFMNRYGVFAIRGAIARKDSDEIDGTINLIDFTSSVSAGQVMIFNQLCAAFLVNYQDVGSTRRILLVRSGDPSGSPIWFVSAQGASLTLVCPAMVSDTPTLYATDGLNIYKMFADSTIPVSVKIQTKLWDMGDPITSHQALKMGIGFTAPGVVITLNTSVDTETGGNSYVTSGAGTLNWVNNLGNTITFVNNSSQPLTWIAGGYLFLKQDVSNIGKYLGFTYTATIPVTTFNAIMIEYADRVRW